MLLARILFVEQSILVNGKINGKIYLLVLVIVVHSMQLLGGCYEFIRAFLLFSILFFSLENVAFARDVLKVGVTGGVHEKVMTFVKKRLDEQSMDFDLDVKVFNDFIHPNVALAQGDLDINSYQHKPFMDDVNKQRGYDLVFLRKNFIVPMGIYSMKTSTLGEIKGRVLIPNDPTNGGRALLLLAQASMIELDESKSYRVNVSDVTKYNNKVKIIEIEAPSIPRLIGDAGAMFNAIQY